MTLFKYHHLKKTYIHVSYDAQGCAIQYLTCLNLTNMPEQMRLKGNFKCINYLAKQSKIIAEKKEYSFSFKICFR